MEAPLEPTVRPAAPADADAITAFNERLAQESEGLALDPATVRTGVRRVLADTQKGVYYLAEVGGRVVGQMLVTREWSDWRDAWFWWIQSVYVAPEWRRTGVYRALHRHVERLARETPDVCGLRLYVDQANVGAQYVYLRLGLHRTTYEFMEADWPTRRA